MPDRSVSLQFFSKVMYPAMEATNFKNALFFPLVVVLWMSSSWASGEDWWRFRGPNGDGVSTETDWTHQWSESGPPIRWQTNVGTGFSTVVTSAGKLYTIGNQENVDTVYCLDVETGAPVWKHAYPSPTDPNEFDGGPTSTPSVDADRVYTLSRSGDLFAFEKRSGKVIWSKNVAVETGVRVPAWGFAGSPLVIDDLLILNVGDAGTAVNKANGKIVWSSEDKDAGYSTAVAVEFDGMSCVVLGSSRSYVCVEVATGKERWRQRWLTTFGCNAADAIMAGGQVFLSSGYNRGSALIEPMEGEPQVIWKHKEFQNQLSSSVLMGGHLFGANGDVDAGTSLTCMEFSTGKVTWVEPSIRPGALCGAGDRLLVLTDSGELVVVAADLSQFVPLARHQVLDGKCWSAPVLSNGRIYCRSADGQLVCVDVRP